MQLTGSSAARGLLPLHRPRGLCTGTPAPRGVLSLKQGHTTLPRAKASPTRPAGAPGAARSRGSQPSPAAARGEQGTHTAGELLERKTIFINTETETAGQDLPGFCWRTRKRPDLCSPTALAADSYFCGTVWVRAQVPLPKRCLWSRFLTDFSLELGSRTFSSYPRGCQTMFFAPSFYGKLFPIFSHHLSVHVPHLSFTALGFSLAYVSLNINGPEMIPTNKLWELSILRNLSASSNCWVIYLPVSLLLLPSKIIAFQYFLVSPFILFYRQSLSNLLLASLFPLCSFRLSLQRQGSQRNSWPAKCILWVPEQGHLHFTPCTGHS